jgi:hypothetical protein
MESRERRVRKAAVTCDCTCIGSKSLAACYPSLCLDRCVSCMWKLFAE